MKIEYPVKLFRELEEGEQFVMFADPAESQDFCAAVAISKKHFDCPLVFNWVMESSQFGYELFYMAKFIQKKTNIWPKLAVERNTGQATIYVLKTLNYPDLFRMVDFTSTNSAEKGEIGWVTTGSLSGGVLQGTRRKMLDDLSVAINQGMIKFYDETQIRQLMSFVISKGGRAQAMSNKKDDLVFACYSEDTEVLTGNGWKLITDVEIGEKIPSLNLKTNKVELAINTATINNLYKGKMIHFKGRSVDFLVTPNHKMVVHKSKGQNEYTEAVIERADSLLGKHFRLHKDAQWGDEIKEKWIIPGYKSSKFHKNSMIKNHLRPRLNHHGKDDVTEVDYDGRQVCLSLDKNHIMLVRRNRTTMWSGNTAGAWQIQLLTPENDFGDYDPIARQKERNKWRFK